MAYLYRDAIAQQLIGTQICLVQRYAGHVAGSQQSFDSLRNGGIGVAAPLQACAQQVRLDAAVVLVFAPVAEINITQAAIGDRCGDALDNAVLCDSFGAQFIVHLGSLPIL